MKPIKPRQNNDSCILRFSHKDRRYSLTFGIWSDPLDRARMEVCGRMIQQDCLANTFDRSLRRYKCWLLGVVPEVGYGNSNQTDQEDLPPLLTLLEERILENYNSADWAVLKLLKQFKKEIDTPELAQAFMKSIAERGVSASSKQRYLNTLKALRRDLFGGISVRVQQKPRPKPFTKQEVTRILTFLKESPFYCHWHDWVLLLFNTGLRTSESIGLRWQDVDLREKIIHVYESLGRGENGGTSSANRIRKPTKTANYRTIPVNDRVYEMLCHRAQTKHKKEDLIFTSPKGKVIDERNFGQRGWKITLEQLGIEHRPFYCTRSTFASHCAEAGLAPHVIAQLLGHSRVSTTFDYYLGTVGKPTLPEL